MAEWSPDLDLNSLGPVVDPDHPSHIAKRRHRLLLEMLLQVGDFATINKILAAYPYLKVEYADRVMRRRVHVGT